MWKPTLFLVLLAFGYCESDYSVGVGIADCTGLVTDVALLGFGKLSPTACGIHLRLFSRAFIVDDGQNRTVFVSVDVAMITNGVRKEVLKHLALLYGNLYTDKNVMISATNTHGSPGGYTENFLYDIPTMGFVPQTYEAVTVGITKSIVRAHENLVPCKIFLNSGLLFDVNINRSPLAYSQNPESERKQYTYDVDKELVQLKFVRKSDKVTIGVLNWYSVHGISMNSSNCLVTSDNLGYASLLLEEHLNGPHIPGKGTFVGAFASSNEGDASPNVVEPICPETGEKCDPLTSTCYGLTVHCAATGPGKDMFESTKIIATRLYEKAKELLRNGKEVEITGSVRFIHQYIYIPFQKVLVKMEENMRVVGKGCAPALGYSFAAGSTDDPGTSDFAQSLTTEKPSWDFVRDMIFPPDEDNIECHYPKPILLNTDINNPYQWQEKIMSIQLIEIGSVIIVAAPGEFTTMAGRRLKNAVKEAFIDNQEKLPSKIILAGLSNTYGGYVATREEYQLQRYEGASTVFGPYTLEIYMKKYKELMTALIDEREIETGPNPSNNTEKVWSFLLPTSPDSATKNGNFGTCFQQPPATVKPGRVVEVKFVAGNPRNDPELDDTFLVVERAEGNEWKTVATDANWETSFTWRRFAVMSESAAIIKWHTRKDEKKGVYRIRHFGSHKIPFGYVEPYEGTTKNFTLI